EARHAGKGIRGPGRPADERAAAVTLIADKRGGTVDTAVNERAAAPALTVNERVSTSAPAVNKQIAVLALRVNERVSAPTPAVNEPAVDDRHAEAALRRKGDKDGDLRHGDDQQNVNGVFDPRRPRATREILLHCEEGAHT
ncbi:MAG TPA: hypothetical protein VHE79_04710, partial [Spirochaetia bacterium]